MHVLNKNNSFAKLKPHKQEPFQAYISNLSSREDSRYQELLNAFDYWV